MADVVNILSNLINIQQQLRHSLPNTSEFEGIATGNSALVRYIKPFTQFSTLQEKSYYLKREVPDFVFSRFGTLFLSFGRYMEP